MAIVIDIIAFVIAITEYMQIFCKQRRVNVLVNRENYFKQRESFRHLCKYDFIAFRRLFWIAPCVMNPMPLLSPLKTVSFECW